MYLVTGGAGFIGSHLVDALLARGDEVVCLDDFNDFYDPLIKRRNVASHLSAPAFHLVEADIRDTNRLDRMFREFQIKKIVHLAARAGVRPSLDLPLMYEDVNVRGTIGLLELARKHNVSQVIFASSSSVYGAYTSVPFHEELKIDRTVSPYAATKYAAELMCYTFHHLYGTSITCLRFFTAYGPRQRPEMAIHKFARLIYEGKPVPFFGDGSTARDYTYIADIIQGLVSAIDRPQGFQVFNLGESRTVTLKELVKMIEQLSGRIAVLEMLPAQLGDVDITFADISKARRLLEYSPATPIEDGLKSFLAWFEGQRMSG